MYVLDFYWNFDKIRENAELVIYGVQNKADPAFYKFFEEVQSNIELAK